MKTLLVADVTNMLHSSVAATGNRADYNKIISLFSEFSITRRLAYGENFGSFLKFLSHLRFKSYQHTEYYTRMVVDTVQALEDFDRVIILGNRPSNVFLFEAAVFKGLQVFSVGFDLPRSFYSNSEMIQLNASHTSAAVPMDVPSDSVCSTVQSESNENNLIV